MTTQDVSGLLGAKVRRAISAAWRGWRGPTGDEFIQVVGIIALLAYIIAEDQRFPDPLPIAVFASLLLHGRYSDRAASLRARASTDRKEG